MHSWYGIGHIGWMPLWWLMGAILIAVVLWAFIKASRNDSQSDDSAQARLKRRYAHGEIDEQTYERISRELRR